ncbi:MAG: helix-turn-helix transcriptional regulator [Synechococcales cyanobacterium T60_A2020_003]|nr:helix-turn-helix transcriptional regulator [Synechococcales cyanobacterium T60_A2020_003]
MNTLTSLPKRADAAFDSRQLSGSESAASIWTPSPLLQAVTEGLVDGILILTQQGDPVYSNSHAQRLCQQLLACTEAFQTVPSEIWHVCATLIENRDVFPEQLVVLEDAIGDRKFPDLRVRVQWIELSDRSDPYLLVMLEDRRQSILSLAITESQKYGLTGREAEVWFRQRSNYTYEEIATELHITVNTVKKHIKSIRAKRQSVWWNEECN